MHNTQGREMRRKPFSSNAVKVELAPWSRRLLLMHIMGGSRNPWCCWDGGTEVNWRSLCWKEVTEMIKSHLLCWHLQWHSIEVTSWHFCPLHHSRLCCCLFCSHHTWFESWALSWIVGFVLDPCLYLGSWALVWILGFGLDPWLCLGSWALVWILVFGLCPCLWFLPLILACCFAHRLSPWCQINL